jgi:hypothetical protein
MLIKVISLHFKMIFKIVFFLFFVALKTDSQSTCDSSWCNYSGLCREIDKIKSCECVDGYSGDRCEIWKDLCSDDNCAKDSKCM